jgi:hypothetical protein
MTILTAFWSLLEFARPSQALDGTCQNPQDRFVLEMALGVLECAGPPVLSYAQSGRGLPQSKTIRLWATCPAPPGKQVWMPEPGQTSNLTLPAGGRMLTP